jgi:hypothetical protein
LYGGNLYMYSNSWDVDLSRALKVYTTEFDDRWSQKANLMREPEI